MSCSVDFDVSLESEEEENPIEDGDTVQDISKTFRQYNLSFEECSSLKKKYVKFADNSKDFSKIVIGLGNEMQVYDLTSTGLSKYISKNDFGVFSHPVSGVSFFKEDPNLVLASTIAGEIVMYDLRTFKKVHTFEDDTEVIVKPVNCFDVNSNDKLICAGTDELNGNVYLLFFDVRERRLMGEFFESHQEEITDVKFHSHNPDILASGSTDGLINIFDCKQESEDDALQFSLNTCDSVQKIKWHHKNSLSCITNTNDLLLYNYESQDLMKKWSRTEITDAMKRKSVIDCNLIDCYDIGDEMMFLGTSNYNKGECLRSLKFNDTSLTPLADFKGNSQIIRASLFDETKNVYMTFGEKAIISVWSEGSAAQSTSQNLKDESSVKKKMKKKNNPY